MKRIGLLIVGICALLSACSDTKKIAPKEGRISVISERELEKSTKKIKVDKAVPVSQWVGSNTNVSNKRPAVSLTKAVSSWKARGGTGRSKNALPLPSPVVVKDTVYTLDSASSLIARQVNDGQKLWQADWGESAAGVGLAVNGNLIVALNEKGTVAVFDTKGKQLWKKELNVPFRNAPLLADNTLYLLASTNDFWVLNAKTGHQKWHYKTNETQTLLQGMGCPALSDNVIIVPFSTGEVVAFDAFSGTLLWSQDLIGKKVFNAISSLSQMSASPVIEKGIVYLVGHAEQTMAVNLKTGESLWRLAQGGKTTPLISGNALFFVNNQNNLLALNKKSGKLFWQTPLENGDWKGPYLIDGKLMLFSDEKGAIADINTGSVSYVENRIQGSFPAITNEGVFFLGDNGRLYHWGKI